MRRWRISPTRTRRGGDAGESPPTSSAPVSGSTPTASTVSARPSGCRGGPVDRWSAGARPGRSNWPSRRSATRTPSAEERPSSADRSMWVPPAASPSESSMGDLGREVGCRQPAFTPIPMTARAPVLSDSGLAEHAGDLPHRVGLDHEVVRPLSRRSLARARRPTRPHRPSPVTRSRPGATSGPARATSPEPERAQERGHSVAHDRPPGPGRRSAHPQRRRRPPHAVPSQPATTSFVDWTRSNLLEARRETRSRRSRHSARPREGRVGGLSVDGIGLPSPNAP